MQNFERKATLLVYELAQKVPNYAPELHASWTAAIKRCGVDINTLGDCGDNAMAGIVRTEDFSFCGLDVPKCSSKAILVIAPADVALEAEDIFEQPYELCEQPTLNLSFCHAVARWTTQEGFVFEMNAKLILEILEFEKYKLNQEGVLHIPVVFFSGRFVSLKIIAVSPAMHAQLAQMAQEVSNDWNPQKLSQEQRDEFLKDFELAVEEGMYPPYGFMIGTSLRVWTSYDMQAH